MMRKSLVIMAIAILLGLGGIYARSSGLTMKRLTQQQNPKRDRKEESRRVYKGLGNQYDTKIPDAAAKATGDIKTEREPGLLGLEPFAAPFNLHNLLKRRGCDADAIIIVTIKSGDSFLTEDETFLYTNYKATVEDVLKDNSIHSGDTVTVTGRGGTIILFGKKVDAIDKNALPLKLNKRYLLFLSYIPERDAYVADNIAYLLENDKIVKTWVGPSPKEMESGNDATTFIQAVRAALAEPCPTIQGGAR